MVLPAVLRVCTFADRNGASKPGIGGKRGSIISQSNFAGRGRAVSQSEIRTYAQAMRQANKEARAHGGGACVHHRRVACGRFRPGGTDIWVFHTPLWVIGGCVAPWIAAVVAAVVAQPPCVRRLRS